MQRLYPLVLSKEASNTQEDEESRSIGTSIGTQEDEDSRSIGTSIGTQDEEESFNADDDEELENNDVQDDEQLENNDVQDDEELENNDAQDDEESSSPQEHEVSSHVKKRIPTENQNMEKTNKVNKKRPRRAAIQAKDRIQAVTLTDSDDDN